MTLKWKMLNDTGFAQGLMKLFYSSEMDAKTAYRVGRIYNRVLKEQNLITEKYHELLAVYAVKDDKGLVKNIEKNGPFEFETPEKEKQYDETFRKMMEETTFDEK